CAVSVAPLEKLFCEIVASEFAKPELSERNELLLPSRFFEFCNAPRMPPVGCCIADHALASQLGLALADIVSDDDEEMLDILTQPTDTRVEPSPALLTRSALNDLLSAGAPARSIVAIDALTPLMAFLRLDRQRGDRAGFKPA